MKLRVCILTITDGQNYGNRLQNYALQQILNKLGCSVDTVKMLTHRDRTLVQEGQFLAKQYIKKLLRKGTLFTSRERKQYFDRFNELINWSAFSIRNDKPDKGLGEAYDYYICGSDQVWNTRIDIVKENINSHLASFAPAEKRISYAASFGTNDILPVYLPCFRNELASFKAIGLREQYGKQIVRDCCGRMDTEVVLDPTMLLDVDEWRKIARKPEYIVKQRFIVTYFLNGRTKNVENYIKQICKTYEAIPINLDIEFLDDNKIKDRNIFCTAPDEFIWLIDHSECVLTDSFHATVFAILFHKPFAVFERKAVERGNDMGSRIDTLLERFSLTRFRGTTDNMDVNPDSYNFDEVEHIISAERMASINFLKNSLGISDL